MSDIFLFFRVSNADVDSMKPTKPYEQPKAVKNRNWVGKHEPVPGKPYVKHDLASNFEALGVLPQKTKLDQYKPNPAIEKILTHGKQTFNYYELLDVYGTL